MIEMTIKETPVFIENGRFSCEDADLLELVTLAQGILTPRSFPITGDVKDYMIAKAVIKFVGGRIITPPPQDPDLKEDKNTVA